MASLPKSSLPLLGYFAKNYPKQSATVVFALILAAFAETLGIGALLPLVTMVLGQGSDGSASSEILNKVFHSIGLEPTLGVLLTMVVVMICTKATIVFFALRYAGFVSTDIARQFQMRLINALMKAQWQYFSGLSLGLISNSIAAEAQRAGHSYMLAGRALATFIQAIIYIAAALFVSWQLSVMAIILGGVFAFLVKGLINAARKTGQDLSITMDDLLSELNQSLNAAKPLKAMGMEDRFCDQLQKETGAVASARKKQCESGLLLQLIYEPAIIVCLAIGLYYVLTFTQTPVSHVLLLAFLFQRLMGYVSQTQSHYQNMAQNENAVWSMQRQIEQAQEMRESLSGKGHTTFSDKIIFNDVDIAYRTGKKVFENFSCEIPYKKLTVLFGPSGVGKTTLIDAVLGLIPVASGALTIDGKDLSKIDLFQWRQMTGYVPQDNFLFHDSVRWNVTLGDTIYTDTEIMAALEKASAKDFVVGLPDGLNTIVGERGGRLSGGQRQRIILARALIRKPKLLILDEPTSALDKENEKMIFSVLKDLSSSMAIILISHNENVLNLTDHVIRLK